MKEGYCGRVNMEEGYFESKLNDFFKLQKKNLRNRLEQILPQGSDLAYLDEEESHSKLRKKVEKSLPKGLDWDSYYLDEKVNDNMSPKRVVTHCMSPLEVIRKRKEILAKIENCDERFELFCMFVLTPMQLTST